MALLPGPRLQKPLRPSLTLVGDPERSPDKRTELAELRIELDARQDEAVALVDGLMPLLSPVISGCMHLGPRHHQLALTIRDRLDRYRRQNLDPEPEAA